MAAGHHKGSKESPAPLDAYATLKSGEPYFVLQGGDRFASPTLEHYIALRREAGIRMDEGKQRDAELLRCMEAEKVLWTMQSYYRGEEYSDEEEDSEEEAEQTIEAVNLFDARRQAAGRISNMFSELTDIVEALDAVGYDQKLPMLQAVRDLRLIFNQVEPRPGRHIANP